jgi:hypothetical protein
MAPKALQVAVLDDYQNAARHHDQHPRDQTGTKRLARSARGIQVT